MAHKVHSLNAVNVLVVADAMEHGVPPATLGIGFNMNWWYSPTTDPTEEDLSGRNCGTVACIGGWTEVVFGISHSDPMSVAKDTLGLSEGDANHLFFPRQDIGECHPYDATMDQAIFLLRHLAETGEIDWELAMSQPTPVTT